MPPPRRSHRPGGPALLPTFFAGTLAMILAIVAMALIDTDWADLGAVVFLVVAAVLVLLAIGRLLSDDDSDQL